MNGQQNEPSPTAQINPIPLGSYVNNSTNHTFSLRTITPITRYVKINEYCYSLYSTLHKIPLAVHQFLDKTIIQGTASRKKWQDKFFKHAENITPQDEKFFVDPSYYDKTKISSKMSYDKGHMAPAKNYCGSQQNMNKTFSYANCIPQKEKFNRGDWKNLQIYSRQLISNNFCQTIEIISGPIFYSGLNISNQQNIYLNKQLVLMENGIVIPPKCYKIIKANVGSSSYVAAFILDNKNKLINHMKIKDYLITMDELQYMTGLRFDLGQYRSLKKLDPDGMSKTFEDLFCQNIRQTFKEQQTIKDINGRRKMAQRYQVSVDTSFFTPQKKKEMAQNDYKNIINQVGWVKISEARKIFALLDLYQDCVDMDCCNPELKQNIASTIFENLQGAKKNKKHNYHNLIAQRIYNNSQKYKYPYEKELKQIFPNTAILKKRKEIFKKRKQIFKNKNQKFLRAYQKMKKLSLKIKRYKFFKLKQQREAHQIRRSLSCTQLQN